ncbi:glycosyl hydrolase family 8 [Acerihabitans sp. TG2]|uniref:glycosyl hydrolase family 8 n=1 Tax=Acerihabitans sp. TG2 TaxID=3096008 RepID=UPI002B23C31A|nr:glycosyl hydrolase family 8 [Acerihabitans sp. TG2]MEA9389002.1 glycosyl hydrolase family 8 [Acerihabitans sp. TG2]
MRGRIFFFMMLATMVFSLTSPPASAVDRGWLEYKTGFILPNGRIVDTGNHDISHSEGQGYGMLLAVFNDDGATFDSIWNWTNKNLYRPDVGLFSWRYDPNAVVKVADKNTASDGDTLIAWALLLAGEKWHRQDYIDASTGIQDALINQVIITFSRRTLMLPGRDGFDKNSYIILNPSYFIFPAWKAFFQHSHRQIWNKLAMDSLGLLKKMQFGTYGLPTDWVSLTESGVVEPATGWPERFSFDAVRIPLYLAWNGADAADLAPFVKYWKTQPYDATPAWINVISNSTSSYYLSPGMSAIRDLVINKKNDLNNNISPKEDYYSASLHLLSFYAKKS